jgi:hypothetical protein
VDLWLGALLGFAVGAVLAASGRPLTSWLERLFRRRVWRENPVLVHVERDQSLIWAGNPPWVGFTYFFTDTFPSEPPPEACVDWSRWAIKHGGLDVGLTMLEITIQAKADAAVVIGMPRVRTTQRSRPTGVVAVCPAGGADLAPRRFEIDLDTFDPPSISYMNAQSGEDASPPTFKLAAGDVERFHIWARASGGLHEWTIDLPLLVEGHRQVITVADGRGQFITIGSHQGQDEHFWWDGQWTARGDL